ncbi:MAG: Mrp/NBP35 family ATP-binding protein [Exilispira sp.]|jgi:Mrp family chromosome partitioning ATPase|nr:Mrp/NBP35 family ATP-binding protein [Exilispira sp.]
MAENSMIAKLNPNSSVKKVIAVISGKGGVGKSIVTSLLAMATNKKGYKTAILDADLTGPSIPKIFGLKEKILGTEFGLFPAKSKNGINIVSLNLFLNQETDPVIWRGPLISNTVKQFWSDIIWENIDIMFIDMPPGTGDVPLTVFQSIPIDGIILVTSPQELVSMIVTKSLNMAKMMNIPIIGIIENMSYFKCPKCGEEEKIFCESHIEELSIKNNIPLLAKIPIISDIARLCDSGEIELFSQDLFSTALEEILSK